MRVGNKRGAREKETGAKEREREAERERERGVESVVSKRERERG